MATTSASGSAPLPVETKHDPGSTAPSTPSVPIPTTPHEPSVVRTQAGTKEDPIVIDWAEGDVENPLNWSRVTKVAQTVQASAHGGPWSLSNPSTDIRHIGRARNVLRYAWLEYICRWPTCDRRGSTHEQRCDTARYVPSPSIALALSDRDLHSQVSVCMFWASAWVRYCGRHAVRCVTATGAIAVPHTHLRSEPPFSSTEGCVHLC